MGLRATAADEDAVSPVVGVVILVALVVVLGGVSAAFFLGIGEENRPDPPQASFSYDLADQGIGCDVVTVSYDAGETIDAENLVVSVADRTKRATDVGVTGEIEGGTSFTLPTGVGRFPCFSNGSTLRIYWESPDGDERHPLATLQLRDTEGRLRGVVRDHLTGTDTDADREDVRSWPAIRSVVESRGGRDPAAGSTWSGL